MFKIRPVALSLLIGGPLLAADALEIAARAPADSYVVLTWSGADAAAPGFAKTQLGQLWAETQVQEFIHKPLDGGLAALRTSIQRENKDFDKYAPLVTDFLSRLWRQPGLICAFP